MGYKENRIENIKSDMAKQAASIMEIEKIANAAGVFKCASARISEKWLDLKLLVLRQEEFIERELSGQAESCGSLIDDLLSEITTLSIIKEKERNKGQI